MVPFDAALNRFFNEYSVFNMKENGIQTVQNEKSNWTNDVL